MVYRGVRWRKRFLQFLREAPKKVSFLFLAFCWGHFVEWCVSICFSVGLAQAADGKQVSRLLVLID